MSTELMLYFPEALSHSSSMGMYVEEESKNAGGKFAAQARVVSLWLMCTFPLIIISIL